MSYPTLSMPTECTQVLQPASHEKQQSDSTIHLSSGVRPVGVQVVHFWEVGKLDLAAGEWPANVAAGGVVRVCHGDGAGCLCHAIALDNRGAKADPQELHDLTADWRRPSRHDPHMTCRPCRCLEV